MTRYPALAAGLVALTTVACNAPPPDTFPGQPVTQRIRLFKEILRNFEPIGLMARGKQRFDPVEAVARADEVRRLAGEPWQHFPPGSDYAPTKARAAVWESPDDFRRARESFIGTAAKLAVAARTHQQEAVRIAYEEVVDSCSSCHKTFRR